MQKQNAITITTLLTRLLGFALLIGGIFYLSHLNSNISKPIVEKPFDPNEDRLQTAVNEKAPKLIKTLKKKGINWNQLNIFIRAFKEEKKLEIWGKNNSQNKFTLIKSYEFCSTSGVLGPKRKRGDLQIPEGIYHIDRFYEKSSYYLSLGLNYPNKSDKIRGHQKHPGGDIFIHGACATIGCIPITDDKIKEVFLLANQAKTNGQVKIPVHIFPAKLSDRKLKSLADWYPDEIVLWKELKPFYDHFEKTKAVSPFKINSKGVYRIEP